MKRNMILLVLSLLVLSLVSVVNAQESITIWITGDENEANSLQEAALAFTETSGIEVNVEAVGWGDAQARYLTAINSGTGADLFAGGMSWGISFGAIGGLVDLSEAFADEYEDVLGGANPEFVGAIVPPSGEVYGVPYSQDLIMMYYLPENLAAVGFDSAPATWDELTEAITALQEAGLGGAGFGWGHAEWIGFQAFLAQAGGSWYNEDCTAAAINSEEALTALEFYTGLYEEYGFPAEAASTAGLAAGELSILFDGEWSALGIDPSYPELEGKWALASLPAGPAETNPTFLGGKMMGLFAYSPNQEAAWEFIKWLQTEEAAAAMAEGMFAFSSLWLPPQMDNLQFVQGDAETLANPIVEQLATTTGPANCAGWEENQTLVNGIIQSVIFEGTDFEDALFELEDLLNQGLEDYS